MGGLEWVAAGTGASRRDEPLVDIIAVHGLNPKGKADKEHARDTWRKPAGQDGHMWLKEELAAAVPRARIGFVWYDSNPSSYKLRESIQRQGSGILESIRVERRKVDANRPIIFLMHSLGGIMVKSALVTARNDPRYESILEATHGLVFFGTPHGGGNQALVRMGNAASKIVQQLLLHPSNDLMNALKTGSMFSDTLRENFRHQYTRYQIISYYERIGNIVSQEDATFMLSGDHEAIVGLDTDHSNLCKFDPNAEVDRDVLKIVLSNLEELVEQVKGTTLRLPEVPGASLNPRENGLAARLRALAPNS